MYTHIHIYIYICLFVVWWRQVGVRLASGWLRDGYGLAYIYIYIYIYVYIYMCIYICIHTVSRDNIL